MSAGAGTLPPTARRGRWTIAWRRRAAVPWPLVALVALAALVRFSTLGRQSLWFDEAFTPVHVLHHSLWTTLKTVAHTENSPPLWYLLIWGWTRVLGTGAIALRALSALAGCLLVGAGWGVGARLGGRRAAIMLAAVLACNPLMVWYSQEARAYELFALTIALSLWAFLVAWQRPSGRALALWAPASIAALCTHYFAAFVVAPEALLLLAPLFAPARERVLPLLRADGGPAPRPLKRWPRPAAAGALVACAAALAPLIAAQGGHGTQWIGRWALSGRLVAIPGYFLLGGQSPALGHALLILCALPPLAALVLLTPALTAPERRAALLVGGLGVVSIAVPLLMALGGADYLAPRNLIGSWVLLAAALAVVLAARRARATGALLCIAVCVAGLAIVALTDARPRFQRANWSALAAALPPAARSQGRAIVTVQLGSAPLEYYLPATRRLPGGHDITTAEVDLVGYAPLRAAARRPITPAFRLAQRIEIDRLYAYRFVAATPQTLTEAQLVRDRLTPTQSEVLVQRR